MSNESSMKGGERSMEQAELLVQILAEIRQQNAMLQSTIAEFLDFAIQANLAYVNKLSHRRCRWLLL